MAIRLEHESVPTGAIVGSIRVVAGLVTWFVLFALVDVHLALWSGESRRTGTGIRSRAATSISTLVSTNGFMTPFGNSAGSFPTGTACEHLSLDLVVSWLIIGTYGGAQLRVRTGLDKVFHGRLSVDWYADGSLLGAHIFPGDVPVVVVVGLQHSFHRSDSGSVASLIGPWGLGWCACGPPPDARIIQPTGIMLRCYRRSIRLDMMIMVLRMDPLISVAGIVRLIVIMIRWGLIVIVSGTARARN